MIKRAQIDELEKLIGQLNSLHSELSALVKKSPNDALNKFKIKFVNAILERCNALLGKKYSPLDAFSIFDEDDVTSNSDASFIIAQYIEAAEKYRSDNVKGSHGFWYYDLPEGEEQVRTPPPAKLKE